jgi:hypothetical protein
MAQVTLTEFLLARITEDEAVASRGGRHNAPGVFANDNYGCLLVDPARILAECEVKRWIIGLHLIGWDPYDAHDVVLHSHDRDTMRALVLPYSDHPDCRDEWKP